MNNTGATFTTATNYSVTLSDATVNAADINTIDADNGSGTVSIGDASINVASGETIDLNSIVSTGTLTVNDSAGNETIIGTDTGDIINLSDGDDNITLGTGDDTINFNTSSHFDSSNSHDTISDTGGNDSINFTNSVTNDLDFSNVSGLENLNFSDSDDTATFGSDEFVAGIRTLDLGDGTNSVDLNNDNSASVQVNGGSGNDTFELDFSRVTEGDYLLNGGSGGTDTVKISNSHTLGGDTSFAASTAFDNIDRIDLSAMTTLDGADTDEFTFTGALVNSWNNNDADNGTISLKLTAAQLENIGYTDDSSVYHDSVSAGTSYSLESGATLTIESIT